MKITRRSILFAVENKNKLFLDHKIMMKRIISKRKGHYFILLPYELKSLYKLL